MTETPKDPSVEELQKTIADLNEKVKGLEAEKAKAETVSQQLADLQKKHDDLMATNMKLIQYIPASGGSKPAEESRPKDINTMSDDERYDYLKSLALKGIEKKQ